MKHLLVQRATVERWSSREPDANFLLTPDWSEVATDVRCNIQEKTGKVVAGQSVEYSAVGYFLSGTDVRPSADDAAEGDRVTVSGKVYYVLAVTDQVGRGKFLKTYLRSA